MPSEEHTMPRECSLVHCVIADLDFRSDIVGKDVQNLLFSHEDGGYYEANEEDH